jgi:hypothetical protein
MLEALLVDLAQIGEPLDHTDRIRRSGLRATSMRRPARVKPFFLVVPFVQPTADQREALASSLSFLERFFVRPSIQPIADQREAHNAAIPNFQITDSPYFHPHSWWSCCSGASWVFSIGNGCCRLGAEVDIAVSSDFVPSACRSHPNSAICFESC